MHPIMLPMAMLMRAPAAVGGGGGDLGLVSSGESGSSASEYTFTAQALGTADAGRLIFLCVGGRNNYPTAVTIGGVSASLLVMTSTGDNNGQSSIWVAAVPTGTTGNVVITMSATSSRVLWSAYRAVGYSATPHDTAADINASLSIDTVAGGALIACSEVYYSGGDRTPSWTGITAYGDELADGIINHSSGYDDDTSGSTTSVDPNWETPISSSVYAAAVALDFA